MAANDAQNLFDYYDTYWFTHQIFKKTQNPYPQTHINPDSIFETEQNLDFPAIHNTNDSLLIESPNSVLNHVYSPKLETIFSGKESSSELLEEEEEKEAVKVKKGRPVKERKKNNRKKSKSLSELEFEELKGFMDLGFLFSEKDKDSSKLVSIIPGLQRLGGKELDYCKDKDDDHNSSRPYLSEAWDEKIEDEEPLIKIPAFGNEIEIKDQLKFWAHSVAASVVIR